MSKLEQVVERIQERTQEIDRAERVTPGATDGIEALYRNRGSLIHEALELGADAGYLSQITGNGR